MRLIYIILAVIIVAGLVIMGQQNNKVYKNCVDEGIHTNEKCYELAYL